MKTTNETFRSIFSLSAPRAGRYPWVDYAKGIAIIFVVYRHVIYGLLYRGIEITPALMDANELLYGFRMPLFFFLSGLFFAGSVQRKGADNFLLSKVNTLLYPYLLWAVLQLTLQLLFSEYTNAKRGIGNFVDILIHPRSMLQLWYLLALFNVSVLYLFADKVLKLRPWMQLAIGVVFLGLKDFAGDISTITDILVYYIYFACGHIAAPYFFRENIQERLASLPGLLVLLPVFVGVQYYCMQHQDMNIYLFSVLAIVGGIVVIMASMLLGKHGKLGFLRTIGHYSLYIYLLHVSIVFLLRMLLIQIGVTANVPLSAFILVVSGIYLSIVVYRLMQRVGMEYMFKGPFKEATPKNGGKKMPVNNMFAL
ncbi:acyltransferase [Chitinophaga sp.]|mgnify:CR=1 FL=1|uniref:acyltransferase family protein n=1 Tax=Chitinophaga sp. TaxID=1869181 RepID=UPI00261F8F10|nr:acyltransferase [uncultured Chitinophaga sp.]